MSDPLLLILGAGLVDNLALGSMLGLAVAAGDGQRVTAVRAIALSTMTSITAAAMLYALTDHWLLAPLGLPHLRALAFSLILAVFAQGASLRLRATAPALHARLPLFGVLIFANGVLLGAAVLAPGRGFFGTTLYALAAAAGFALALTLFAAVLDRLAQGDVPAPFRGLPAALLTAGLAALGVLGLAGVATP